MTRLKLIRWILKTNSRDRLEAQSCYTAVHTVRTGSVCVCTRDGSGISVSLYICLSHGSVVSSPTANRSLTMTKTPLCFTADAVHARTLQTHTYTHTMPAGRAGIPGRKFCLCHFAPVSVVFFLLNKNPLKPSELWQDSVKARPAALSASFPHCVQSLLNRQHGDVTLLARIISSETVGPDL